MLVSHGNTVGIEESHERDGTHEVAAKVQNGLILEKFADDVNRTSVSRINLDICNSKHIINVSKFKHFS